MFMASSKDIFDAYGELEEFLSEEEKSENVDKIFESPKTPSLEDELFFIDDIDFKHDLNEEEMNNTKEINLFEDGKFQKALDRINEEINKEDKAKEEEKPKVLKMTKKETSLEAAFVNCSILGFITLFAGFGWLYYIIDKIAG